MPDGEGIVEDDFANLDSIEKITKNVDAIFYTHYHGDHLGLFHFVQDSINQYIGKVAQRVALCKHQRLSYIKGRKEISSNKISKIEHMHAFEAEQIIEIGDIQVIPYFVSHSAYDSYMYLIVSNGKRILHTGDFRRNWGRSAIRASRYQGAPHQAWESNDSPVSHHIAHRIRRHSQPPSCFGHR